MPTDATRPHKGLLGVRRDILLSSSAVLATRVLGAFAGFAATVTVSRLLGAEQAGYYFLAFAVTTVLASVSRIGLDATVLRFVSIASAVGDTAGVQAVLRLSSRWAGGLALSLALVTLLLAQPVATHIFAKPALALPLRLIAAAIPCIALSSLQAQALLGLRQPNASIFLLYISANGWLLLALGAGFVAGRPLQSSFAAASFSAAAGLTLLAGRWFLGSLRGTVPPPQPAPAGLGGQLLQSCLPLFAIDLMALAIQWSSQLLGGAWLPATEFAWLNVAQRTAMLTSMVLLATNASIAPRFAALHHAGKHDELRLLAQSTARLVALVTLPVVVVMCLAPSHIMALFGEGFRGGAHLLPILAAGQLVNALTGSVGYLLVMGGHERDLRNVMLGAGAVALTLPLVLVPRYGATGAAIATTTAVVLQNLLAMGMVRKRLGFWTFSVK